MNIRSIYQNFNQFLVYLELLQKQFDVIVMSETHRIYNTSDFNIPGYSAVFNESSLNKCDGCLIYVKQEFFRSSQLFIEGNLKIISITIQKNNKQIDVLATYRGFAISKEDFLNQLNTVLQRNLEDQDRIYIFTGDINIDLLDSDAENTNNYITMMQSHGFMSIVNKATRKTKDSQTCLDHFFIKCKNCFLQNVNAVILEHKLTDHDPILLNVQLNNNVEKTNKKYSYQVTDFNKLTTLMQQAGWDDVLSINDANICTDNFIGVLRGIVLQSTKTRYISCKKRRIKPWISGGLLVSIRNRDKLKKECTINHNNLALLNRYREYRKMLTKLIKISKYTYYKLLAQRTTNDSRKLWSVIKEATNDQGSTTEINSIRGTNNVEISNKNSIAEEFNKYFSGIGKKLADKINNKTLTGVNVVEKRAEVSFFLNPISESDLNKEIKSLKKGVRGGEDEISSDIIKRYIPYIMKPLLHIVNVVFSTGVFPEILKTAIVIPLHKQGDRQVMSNYRPIALTSTISKIIEKCYRRQLMAFLEKYHLLSNNQFAFREGTSTENALCRVTETVLKNLDKGKKVIGVFLDMQKAFDTVAHHILLKRLGDIGVRGIPNDLIKSYLKRKQRTKIAGEESGNLEVDCGVPQGTVLSTLLFNIYIDGLLSLLGEEGVVFCFADDSGIIISGEDWEVTKQKAEIALQKIKFWLDRSLLSLNVEKTNFVTFALSPRSLPVFRTMRLHDPQCKMEHDCSCISLINRKTTLKYLGVYIDECFTWKDHIKYVTNKIRKLIFKFYELRNILTFSTLRSVYQALVESIINYGIVVWGNAGQTVLRKLQVAQKWVIKIILFKKKRYPTELVFKDSDLLTLNQLYIKAVVRFMLTSTYYREGISHGMCTRGATQNDVVLQNPKHSLCQSSVYVVGPKIYNSLPLAIRSKPYKKCKSELKAWLQTSNYSVTFIV